LSIIGDSKLLKLVETPLPVFIEELDFASRSWYYGCEDEDCSNIIKI